MEFIKFKAWHMGRQELLFATIGKDGGMIFVRPADMYADEREEISYRNPELLILQYTGVKDKTGREIYEGDIVTDKVGSDFGQEVVYDNVSACFKPLNSMNHDELRVVDQKYKLSIN